MDFLYELGANRALMCVAVSWFSAQLLKTALNYFATKEVALERMIGSGGMPSAHTASVISLTVLIARMFGLSSPLFAICFVVSGVVMYDAMGVRRAAGEHAKAINKIVLGGVNLFVKSFDENADSNDREQDDIDTEFEKLKEYLGHTPLEVLGGFILGLFIAVIFPI